MHRRLGPQAVHPSGHPLDPALVGFVAECVTERLDGVAVIDCEAATMQFGVKFHEWQGATPAEDFSAASTQPATPEHRRVESDRRDGLATVRSGSAAPLGEIDPQAAMESSAFVVECEPLLSEAAHLVVEFGDPAAELVVVGLEGGTFAPDDRGCLTDWINTMVGHDGPTPKDEGLQKALHRARRSGQYPCEV